MCVCVHVYQQHLATRVDMPLNPTNQLIKDLIIFSNLVFVLLTMKNKKILIPLSLNSWID